MFNIFIRTYWVSPNRTTKVTKHLNYTCIQLYKEYWKSKKKCILTALQPR